MIVPENTYDIYIRLRHFITTDAQNFVLDGARTGRRHKPVNISDRNCPSLGCTGNLTTDSYNGKGSLAPPTKLSPDEAVLSPNKERRFDSSSATTATSFHHDHHHPLKLEIKSINDSARSDTVDYNNYVVSQDSIDEVGSGRGLVKTAVIISWLVYWAGKAFISFIVINIFKYVWNKFKKAHGIGDDYIEYYVKLGNDAKHPFHNYGAGWNPTFGVSLKSKHEDHGWKGAGGALTYQPHHASSYQYPQGHGHEHWPPPYYAGAQDYGWHHGKGWKSESEEAEDELKHNFDMEKVYLFTKTSFMNEYQMAYLSL